MPATVQETSERLLTERQAFADALLAWYRINRRDLPWRRRQDDAYAVWISEIMLQQTTVAAVTGYYERWMERFPTVEALAAAPLDDVLRYWSGLGYYSRARNIKAAANEIVERWGGALAERVDDLKTLPGVGRYTAGAISSTAYHHSAPILDTNVIRVLSRLALIGGDPKSSVAQAALWRLAEQLIPNGGARDFNQALMELGARVCTPKKPQCGGCPVADWCAARAIGLQEAYPQLPARKAWKSARHVSVAIVRTGSVLLVRRPENAVWAGLWEMPRVIAGEDESVDEAALRAACEIVGLDDARIGSPFGLVRHGVMDTRITLYGVTLSSSRVLDARAVGCAEVAWVDPDCIDTFALPSPQRRLFALWRGSLAQSSLDFAA